MRNLDQSTQVRSGEGLDAAALIDYLGDHLAEILPEIHDGLEIRQFPGGYSNLTYLLRAGSHEVVLRRPPHGANIASAHDMSREYRVISGLHDTFGRVPAPLHYCGDDLVIGAPFYVMERLRGFILRNRLPEGADADAATMRRLSESFIGCLVELHRVDPAAAKLADLGRPAGYVSRQVSGWIRRYEKAATENVPDMHTSAKWLSDNLPAESAVALIHNDFKYDNLVLSANDAATIVGVLDWEMATVGDPLMDLGMSLAYWSQADDPALLRQFGLTSLPGNFRRAELIEAYVRLSGRPVDNPLYYYRFGLYKLAVILQQIYARYHAGLTRDKRFANLIDVVRVCARQSLRESV